MALDSLQGIGLSKREIEVYELLLRTGEMLPSMIAKQLKHKRSTVYKTLYALEEKGMVQQRKLDSKTLFIPEPPAKLLENLESKIKQEERLLKELKSVLPDLNNAYFFSLEKPIIKVYVGLDGLKNVYMDTLAENNLVRMSITAQDPDPEMMMWVLNNYRPERVKKQMPTKVMFVDAPWSRKFLSYGVDPYSEYVTVSPDILLDQHSVAVYGDKVAFINYSNNNNLISIVIQQPLIARSVASWFDLAWSLAYQAKEK